MRLEDYWGSWGGLHAHGLGKPGGVEHEHIAGSIPHRHDGDGTFITLCEGRTLLGDPCAKDLGHKPPCSKIPGEGTATILELAAYTDRTGSRP